MQTIPGKILLHLDRKYTEEIVTEGGLKLYIDPSYRPEWHSTVTGKIVATSPESKLPIGAKVFFSYMVVHKREFGPNADFFVRTVEGNEYVREYTNGNGDTIKVKARQGAISLKWHAILIDKHLNFIDGAQGTESEVERWLAQFKFGSNEQLVYKNLVDVSDKDYWLASESNVFAVETKDGIKAINDFILLKPIEIDITQMLALQQKHAGVIPNTKIRMENQGKVVSSADPQYKKGDVLFYNEAYVEKYTFNEVNYLVLNKKRVVAKNGN